MLLAFCASRIYQGGAYSEINQKGCPAPLITRGFPALPLQAIPAKTSGARRGIRKWGTFNPLLFLAYMTTNSNPFDGFSNRLKCEKFPSI